MRQQKKSVRRKRFQISKFYPKGEQRPISTAARVSLSACVPSSAWSCTPLHNGRSAVCARLAGGACFGAELGASVRHGRSPPVLLLVNEPWRASSHIYRHAQAAHYINCPSPADTAHSAYSIPPRPPSLPTQQLSRFNTHWHRAHRPP